MPTNQEMIDHMLAGYTASCPQCSGDIDIGAAISERAGRGWSEQHRYPAPECSACGPVDPTGIELQPPEFQSTFGFVNGSEVLK